MHSGSRAKLTKWEKTEEILFEQRIQSGPYQIFVLLLPCQFTLQKKEVCSHQNVPDLLYFIHKMKI